MSRSAVERCNQALKPSLDVVMRQFWKCARSRGTPSSENAELSEIGAGFSSACSQAINAKMDFSRAGGSVNSKEASCAFRDDGLGENSNRDRRTTPSRPR